MRASPLQEAFMRDIAAAFKATQARIIRRLSTALKSETADILEDELRGLYHGLFVTFDGGSALADHGLIKITDEDGTEFERHLHEKCFEYWNR